MTSTALTCAVLGFLFSVTLMWVSLLHAAKMRHTARAGISAQPSFTTQQSIIVPVRKDGVIFISDGAKGSAREAAIELAKHGYHVLVGAKSEAEIRSFAFDSRKGLEPILFDITNPSTFVSLIFRLRQIRRELDRPFVGIVLNLAGRWIILKLMFSCCCHTLHVLLYD